MLLSIGMKGSHAFTFTGGTPVILDATVKNDTFWKICLFLEQKHGLKQKPVDKKGPSCALLLPSSDMQVKLQVFERMKLAQTIFS